MQTNKPKTKIITGCSDCPFYATSNLGNPRCKLNLRLKIYLSDQIKGMSDLLPTTPQACPLKTQAIIITYET